MNLRVFTILPVLATVAAAPAQEERRYPVGRFTAVDVAGPDDVTIRSGDADSVSASGPEAGLRDVRVAVRDGTLFISSGGAGHRRGVRLDVALRDLRRVRASGSGVVTLADAKGLTFTGEMAGTGSLIVSGTQEADTAVSRRDGREIRTTVRSETRASANGTGTVTVTHGARCTVLDGVPIRVACN